jgi:polygalacturonase
VVIKSGRNQDAWRLDTPTAYVVVRNCEVVQGHCLMGIGSEMAGGVQHVYMHDCKSTDAVYRMLYIKTNHRRGGLLEDIWMENVSADKANRVIEIDTDVLYQWRDIVPTFETRITKIRNIGIRGATCRQAEAVYEFRGDEREPIDGVTVEDVHVGKLTKFVSNVTNTRNLIVRNVTWDAFTPDGEDMRINGFAPGR